MGKDKIKIQQRVSKEVRGWPLPGPGDPAQDCRAWRPLWWDPVVFLPHLGSGLSLWVLRSHPAPKQPCPPEEIIVMAMKDLRSQARCQRLPFTSSSSSTYRGRNDGAPIGHRFFNHRNNSPGYPSASGLSSSILQKTRLRVAEQPGEVDRRGETLGSAWGGGAAIKRSGLTQGTVGCPWPSPPGNLVLGI